MTVFNVPFGQFKLFEKVAESGGKWRISKVFILEIPHPAFGMTTQYLSP